MDIFGNLRFMQPGDGEFQNFVVERRTGADGSGVEGQIIYRTDQDMLKYFDGTNWQTIGSSGSVAAVQSELDALEGALGSFINSDGTFNEAAFSGFANAGSPATSLFDVLEQLDDAITNATTPPGGANGQIQFNDNGAFGGSAEFTFAASPSTVAILQLGDSADGLLTSDNTLTLDGAEVVVSVAGTPLVTFEGDGSWNVGGSNGTAGQVLTSNGSAAAPTWQDVAATLDELTDVELTSPQANDFLVYMGSPSQWVNRSASQSRDHLGLGTIATQDADDVLITGGSITGITDLAIADGGTGASTAADARTNLGLVAGGDGDIWVEKAGDTMTGDLFMDGAQIHADKGDATAPGYAFFGSPAQPDTGFFAGNTTSMGENVNFVGVAVDGVEIARFERTTAASPTVANLVLSGSGPGVLVLDDASTAADPGLTFLTDEDTGMYHDTPNNIKFSVGGVPALQIESNGTISVLGAGSPFDYVDLVTEDNDLVNKKYVDQAVASFGGSIDLNTLTDVEVGSPALANNDFLVYNSASTNWENQPVAVARESLGLVAGGAGDIWVEKAGDTMSGILNMGGNRITDVADPVADTDATNKAYVDSVAAGLDPKESVRAASTMDVGGSAGSPETHVILNALVAAFDGVALALGNRVLLKDQTDLTMNGIYVVTNVDGGSPETVDLERAPDMDGTPSNEVSAGNFTFVEEGTVYGDSGFVLTGDGILTLGSDDIVWTQFSGAATSINAGVGLMKTGNTLHVNLGAGIWELPGDEVGIELHDASTGAIILTEDGTTRATTAATRLHLLLDANGTLSQGAGGLTVVGTTVEGDAGTDSFLPGETIAVLGDSVQGVSTTVAASPETTILTISVADASDSQKGVASFATPDFMVTAGAVQLAELFTVDANSGTADPIEGGDTLTFTGAAGIDTNVGANTITITNTDRGSAQAIYKTVSSDSGSITAVGNNDAFAIVGGTGISTAANNVGSPVGDNVVVSLDADLDDLNDVVITSPEIGQVVVVSGTASPLQVSNFVNAHIYAESGLRAANTSHAFSHNLGQKYVNVTVVDSSDQVIIPNSITMTDEDTVTVTFGSSIQCRIIVMGVPSFG